MGKPTSTSTIKGESKFSFSVEVSIYTNVKPYTSYYLITFLSNKYLIKLSSEPSAVSNVQALSSVKKGNLSQACLKWFWSYFILSAFYWAFGVKKLRSKVWTVRTVTSQVTVRQTKENMYYFYRLWMNVENVSLKNSKCTQPMHSPILLSMLILHLYDYLLGETS